MTISVRTYPHVPNEASCKTGQPMSNLSVASPCLESANCLNGYMLGGVKTVVYEAHTLLNQSGTGYLYTYRHPNAMYQDVVILVNDAKGDGVQAVYVTAGAGSTLTWNSDGTTSGKFVAFRAPWAASDSGIEPIEITFSNALLRSTVLFDHPRSYLESTDDRLVYQDPTYPAIGAMRDHAVAVSADSGPSGISSEISGAWTRHRRQVFGYWATDANAPSWTSTSYTALWQDIRVRARQKRSTDTTRNVVVAIRSKSSAATNYTVRATSSGAGGSDTVTLNNTAYALNTDLVIPVSCTADDFVKVEALHASAGPTGKIQSVSIIEE